MDISFYITISSIVLFITSEILPFIKNIKGNGLFHSVFELITSILLKTTSDETKMLIPKKESESTNEVESINELTKIIGVLLNKLDTLKNNDLYNYYNDKSMYLSSMDGQQIDMILDV